MDKLKRKLSLLNIPVYEISSDNELSDILYHHLLSKGERVLSENFKLSFNAKGGGLSECDNPLNVIVFQALLAVEESAILFIEKAVNERFQLINISHYTALVVHERNVVDSIEVALHRISSGSDYYNDCVEIISPDLIPQDSIIVFKRNQ